MHILQQAAEDQFLKRSVESILGITLSEGGNGLQFIEKKLVSVNTQDLSFSSLNGNSDDIYIAFIRLRNANTTTTSQYFMQPNFISTNQYTETLVASPSTFQYNGMRICGANASSYAAAFIIMHASTLGFRTILGICGITQPINNTQSTQINGCSWVNDTTPITSLNIHASIVSGIGSGSTAHLYKA